MDVPRANGRVDWSINIPTLICIGSALTVGLGFIYSIKQEVGEIKTKAEVKYLEYDKIIKAQDDKTDKAFLLLTATVTELRIDFAKAGRR